MRKRDSGSSQITAGHRLGVALALVGMDACSGVTPKRQIGAPPLFGLLNILLHKRITPREHETIESAVENILGTYMKRRGVALHRVELFAGVPGRVLAAVAGLTAETRLSAGEALIEEGAVEAHLYAALLDDPTIDDE